MHRKLGEISLSTSPLLRLKPEQLDLACVENYASVPQLTAHGRVNGSEAVARNSRLQMLLKLWAYRQGVVGVRQLHLLLATRWLGVRLSAFVRRLARWQTYNP